MRNPFRSKKSATVTTFGILIGLILFGVVIFYTLDKAGESIGLNLVDDYSIAPTTEWCFSGGINGSSRAYNRIEALPLWKAVQEKPTRVERQRCRFTASIMSQVISRMDVYPDTPAVKGQIITLAKKLQAEGWTLEGGSENRCVFSIDGRIGINIERDSEGWSIDAADYGRPKPVEKAPDWMPNCIKPEGDFPNGGQGFFADEPK